MNARPKKKLCWNCEGSVSSKAESCPYCGVSVAGLPPEMSSDTPMAPYRLVNPAQEAPIPVSPYAEDDDEPSEEGEGEVVEEAEAVDDTHKDDSKHTVLVMSLLLSGSVFFLFGFILFLFSDEGYLTLHWHSGYWFVYLLLAVPLLFFGFRSLNTIQDKF